MNIRILVIIIVMLYFSEYSFSQVSREWISTYHFSADDGKALAIDNSGNVYVTGTSGNDFGTVKYNSSGVQQWVSKYNGPANGGDGASAIAVDLSGNVYVTGGSANTFGNSDYATVKYNSSGVQQWAVAYSGTATGNDGAVSIAVDGSGNVYVTGFTYEAGTNFDYTTIKYNSAGIFQWGRGYNGTGNNVDFATKLVLDGSGNIYVTGFSRGSGASDDNYATIKYSTTGVEQWVRTYNGSGDGFDQAQSIAVDGLGNVYVTGRSLGDTTQYDYATIKYNSAGDSLWVKRYNGAENSTDNGQCVVVDASGNVYVFGQSFKSASNYDFATVKYNSSGVFQWDKIYNGPGNSVENAFAMTLDDSGNVYITGSSHVPGENYNYATVKYSGTGIERWSQAYNGTAGGSDEPYSIAVDAAGNVYITGSSAGLGEFKNYVTIKYSQIPRASIKAFIEGFYNSSSDKMISDTVKAYLRNATTPYAIIDSSKSKLDSAGVGKFYFPKAVNGVNYFLVLKHRNSIETWSSYVIPFTSDSLAYDFSTAGSQAFGNNMTIVDTSPVRFAFYSGDATQDGFINLTDIIKVSNDASSFMTGYVQSDINGDNSVNLTDVLITHNNSQSFISVMRP